MQKILIIEDDKVIARTLKEHLCKWDYDADFVVDFKNITEQVVSFAPQLILLDISLPYFNGFYWCGEIRKFSNVPIIFISSASDKMNIVMAVNMGGDDFISKPFERSHCKGAGGNAPHVFFFGDNVGYRTRRCNTQPQ